MVGVETFIFFRFQKVVVRFSASLIGSPSVPADAGYRSTSSISTTLIGREARPAAELAPTIVMCPPGNVLCRIVFPESLDRASLTFPLSAGVSRSIGASLSFENVCAISRVGCSANIGDGS